MVYEAACANCAHFRDGCTRGLAPPAGEPRCASYEISASFASFLAGEVLRQNPIRSLVPLRHLTSAEKKRLAASSRAKRRRGFRS